MLQKISIGLSVVLLAVTGYLFGVNQKLQRQVEELNTRLNEATVSKHANQKAAGPAPEPSPFDKQHTDPLEKSFRPDPSDAPPKTKIVFAKTEHDWGRVVEGEQKGARFRFTNTGDKPLIIARCVASCGCTVPDWPRVPIPPNSSNEITVLYDSGGKYGEQTQTVTMSTNTDPVNHVLTVKATVVPKDK